MIEELSAAGRVGKLTLFERAKRLRAESHPLFAAPKSAGMPVRKWILAATKAF